MKNLHSNKKKTISIVAPCFNESQIISKFLDLLIKEINKHKNYFFSIIIIDNASTDDTVEILKKYASKYKFIKVIINIRNFGHIRSPYYGIMQSTSDATIYMASDLQDPPSMIGEFIKHWELGYKVVWGVKNNSFERNIFIKFSRRVYYHFLNLISETPIVKNATGFGLYDKLVLNYVRKINDPYPYFRGMVSELGFPIKEVNFFQKPRPKGDSKNNLLTLYDFAMLGIVNHSIVPLRFASLVGILFGIISFIAACIYLILKLLYWDTFTIGVAPLLISMFFLFGILLFFVGIIGEYLLVIQKYLRNRPIVVEKERINFDK